MIRLIVNVRLRPILVAAVACAALAALPAAASAAFTQNDINASIEKGVSFMDANQNPNGSFGTTFPDAETALALASYGVDDSGHFANLTPARQTIVKNGVAFLLSTQQPNGSFAADGLATYDTGLALTALSLSQDVPTTPAGAVATAIANGRQYLINSQNVPPQISCQSTGANGTGLGGQSFCGGWDYNGPDGRSDESNTGFALTGLDLTGGVPTAVANGNIGW
jgi:squalene-hopene/tetraprenyl-beta-curcumene cyclase